jgi:altronate dehydratase large subunit
MKFNLDFNARGIVEGTPIAEVGAELLEKVLRIGSGEPSRAELLGHDELFCITRI